MGIIEQNAHSNRHSQVFVEIWSTLPLQSESRRQEPSVVVEVLSSSSSLLSVVGCEISTTTTVGISLVLGETLSTTDVIVSGHAIESNVPHGTRFGFGVSGIDMDMENPSNLGGGSLMLLLVALKLYRRLNVKSS